MRAHLRLALLTVLLPAGARADIAFDNATHGGMVTTPLLSWNHVINDNTDGIVIVGAELRTGPGGSLTTVSGTYGGLPLIEIRTDRSGVAFGAVSWLGYRLGPPLGTTTVSLNVAGDFFGGHRSGHLAHRGRP
jgi:hypothetical protein